MIRYLTILIFLAFFILSCTSDENETIHLILSHVRLEGPKVQSDPDRKLVGSVTKSLKKALKEYKVKVNKLPNDSLANYQGDVYMVNMITLQYPFISLVKINRSENSISNRILVGEGGELYEFITGDISSIFSEISAIDSGTYSFGLTFLNRRIGYGIEPGILKRSDAIKEFYGTSISSAIFSFGYKNVLIEEIEEKYQETIDPLIQFDDSTGIGATISFSTSYSKIDKFLKSAPAISDSLIEKLRKKYKQRYNRKNSSTDF